MPIHRPRGSFRLMPVLGNIGGNMDFFDWEKSDTRQAQEFRKKIMLGEKGNKNNPKKAAIIAYDAGVQEGIKQAAEKLKELILKA